MQSGVWHVHSGRGRACDARPSRRITMTPRARGRWTQAVYSRRARTTRSVVIVRARARVRVHVVRRCSVEVCARRHSGVDLLYSRPNDATQTKCCHTRALSWCGRAEVPATAAQAPPPLAWCILTIIFPQVHVSRLPRRRRTIPRSYRHL